MIGRHGLMPGDASAVEGMTLSRPTVRRIWSFARPYRRVLAVYLLVILAAALVAIIPPLIVRSIIDTAIPNADRTMITWLAALGVAAAVADAGLNVVQRVCSA
ncbi:MAG TPA: ABC transporter ATP-binding protein, partial [Desertimonas sp.]|nr:ABC transporter ATP-binding protein [Desertimonas sp.]